MIRAASRGPAAKPSFIGSGIEGTKIGIDPIKIPKRIPPNKDKKSGFSRTFSESPISSFAFWIDSSFPTTRILSP